MHFHPAPVKQRLALPAFVSIIVLFKSATQVYSQQEDESLCCLKQRDLFISGILD
ncbi:unnamed protein product [Amoebophrya sp. A25]|nr:unnamed protein product [Amoebophrya sp. A25]|eukprot:GSA25T00003498001.1